MLASARCQLPKRLPIKLAIEPLIDAACELRVHISSQIDLHTVLPGVLLTKLGLSKFEQLPGTFVPSAIRSQDPLGVFNSQLVRAQWGDYYITIGTRNVVIGPKLPYHGWHDFKKHILEVFNVVLELGIHDAIDRYSIKYTNLIEGSDVAQQSAKLDWGVKIGPLSIQGEPTQLRVEIPDERFLTIVQINSGAAVEMIETKTVRTGCVVDVDTLCLKLDADFSRFGRELPERLDAIRYRNKGVFFDCLTDSTIEEMGPTYE